MTCVSFQLLGLVFFCLCFGLDKIILGIRKGNSFTNVGL